MLLDFGHAFMILTTKIALPTFLVLKDLLIIHKVLSLPFVQNDDEDPTKQFPVAYAMICVLVLSCPMTLPHFLRIEKTLRQKLIALPFLLSCSWPQYRASRLIWLAYWVKNEEEFDRENKEFEQTLCHIGISNQNCITKRLFF